MNTENNNSPFPVVIFGSGGVARETVFLIEEINEYGNDCFKILGFVGMEESTVGKKVGTYEIVCSDQSFFDYAKSFSLLGVIIPFGSPHLKKKIVDYVSIGLANIKFPNIVHPSVSFQKYTCSLGYGNIITCGVKITVSVKIGNFNLLNPNSTVGHDTVIGNYNVINPLVAVSGNVVIEDEILIGTGAKILQNLTIKSKAIVGAGAVVTKSVPGGKTVVGIPAKVKEAG